MNNNRFIDRSLQLAVLLLLTPCVLHAEDFSGFLPALGLPFLLVAIPWVLVLRSRIKEDPGNPVLSRRLKVLFFITSIPVTLGLLAVPYILSDGEPGILVYVAMVVAYAYLFRSAYKLCAVARRNRGEPPLVNKKVVFKWLAALVLIPAIIVGIAVFDSEYGIPWPKEKHESLSAYGSADMPKDITDRELRARKAIEAAAGVSRRRVFGQVETLSLKSGGTVGQAMAADPALAEKIKNAILRSSPLENGYCMKDKDFCTFSMSFEKSELRGLGLDLAD
jgi:hypothetical protein